MSTKFTEEDLNYNKILKKSLFEVILEKTDTFYVHCMNHRRLSIGSRGLLENEKKEGIILVFGPYSYRNLDWDENAIYCEMNFGKWESIVIPFECIFRIFDKAGHFIMQFLNMELDSYEKKLQKESLNSDSLKTKENSDDNIIKIDFSKKKRKHKNS